MNASYRLMACGVAFLATSLFAVDLSANAPLNDNIDRTDPNFIKASLLVMGPGKVEILRSKILILEQRQNLDDMWSKVLISYVSPKSCALPEAFAECGLYMLTTILRSDLLIHDGEKQRGVA